MRNSRILALVACLACAVISTQQEVSLPGAGSGRPIQLLRPNGKDITVVPEGEGSLGVRVIRVMFAG